MDGEQFQKNDSTSRWPCRSHSSMDVQEFLKNPDIINVIIYIVNDNEYLIPLSQAEADYRDILSEICDGYLDLYPFEAMLFDKKGIESAKDFFNEISIPYAEIPLKNFNVEVYNIDKVPENQD